MKLNSLVEEMLFCQSAGVLWIFSYFFFFFLGFSYCYVGSDSAFSFFFVCFCFFFNIIAEAPQWNFSLVCYIFFPQSCESSGSSMVGLKVTSSKKAYAILQSAAPRAPSLWQSTADPYRHRKCSNTVLSQSLWGPCVLVHTRSQSILKEISPEYSLEGLMLKLKL